MAPCAPLLQNRRRWTSGGFSVDSESVQALLGDGTVEAAQLELLTDVQSQAPRPADSSVRQYAVQQTGEPFGR